MSERYRVDEGESGYYFIVDQKKGRRLRVESKMQAYMQTIADELNQQAAELREAQAGAAALQEEFKRFLEGVCYWRRVHIGHGMMRAEPTLEDSELERYRNLVHSPDSTAGTELLRELDDLRTALKEIRDVKEIDCDTGYWMQAKAQEALKGADDGNA